MKPIVWVFTLLLSQLVMGCATTYVSREVGYNHERIDGFDRVYADDGHLLVTYFAFPVGGGSSASRWTKIDLKALRWAPPDTMRSQILTDFSPHNGLLELPAGGGVTRISLYDTRGRGWNPAVPDAIVHYREQMQRNGVSRLPFAVYEVPSDYYGELLLIRDDPLHSHEIEVARLAPEKESKYGTLERVAAYPFAIACDVVTSPFQLLFYLALRNMRAM